MKWEYLVVEISNLLPSECLEAKLDVNGYDGWDLVNIINYGKNSKFIFKRELKLEE